MTKVLQNEIRNLTQTISDQYKPKKIILFGSAARDEFGKNSDLDFLIIKNTSKPRYQRSPEVYRCLRNRTLPIDILVYTPEEIQERLSLGDFFIKRVLKEGKVLYDQQ